MKRARLFVLLAALAGLAAAAAAADDRTWFSIAADNGVLGFASRQSLAGAGGRELIETRELRLREMGAPTARIVSRSVVRETPAGHHEESVPLPANVRFDGGGGLLAAWAPAARLISASAPRAVRPGARPHRRPAPPEWRPAPRP